MAVKHKKVSAKADGADNTLIQPSNWNDTHTADGGINELLYVGTGGELVSNAGLTFNGTTLNAPSVTIADAVYNSTSWNGDFTVPTKNAIRDKLEAIAPTPVSAIISTAASGATVSANTTLNGAYPASYAIDGIRHTNNNNEYWHSTNAAYPHLLEITFSNLKSVSSVSVYTLSNAVLYSTNPTASDLSTSFGIVDFLIQYWTGTTWETIPGTVVTGNDKAWIPLSFPAINTTKVRLYITATRDGYSRIPEFEVYGSTPVPLYGFADVYNPTTWNNNLEVPTKDALRDVIETLATKTNAAFTGTHSVDTISDITWGDISAVDTGSVMLFSSEEEALTVQNITVPGLAYIASMSISDAGFTLRNTVDSSKQVVFQLAGLTTGTVRTLTVPNASGTLALLSDITGTAGTKVSALTPVTVLSGTIQFPVTDSGVSKKLTLDQVKTYVGSTGGGTSITVTSPTTSQALAIDSVNLFSPAANVTATLPTAVGNGGKSITVKKVDTSAFTISMASTSAQTIDGSAATSVVISSPSESLTFTSDGANWFII